MPAAIRSLSLPLLACVLTLALTAFAWQQQHSLARQHLQTRFNAQVSTTAARLQQQLDSAAQHLSSVQALYASTGNANRDSLNNFLQQQASFPGLRNISVAMLVLPEQRDAFIDSQRQAGLRDYVIRPGGERAFYAAVNQIVPAASASPTDFGRDLLADPAQQSVLSQARDSGTVALSGRLTVDTANTTGTSGFILAAPLFAPGKPHGTQDERRSNITGWVVASFNAGEWLANAFGERGPELDYTLLDSPEDSEESRLAHAGGAATTDKPLLSAQQNTRRWRSELDAAREQPGRLC